MYCAWDECPACPTLVTAVVTGNIPRILVEHLQIHPLFVVCVSGRAGGLLP
jgi:hypothetical protein